MISRMNDDKSSNKWKPHITMTGISFSFAIVNILLKKVLEKGVDHLVFITYRLAVSAGFLCPIGYFWERPKLTLRILGYLFLSAIVGASLPQYFFLWGIHYTSATFASAFVNMVPVITFMMALPFGLETLNIGSNGGRGKLLDALLCVGGAMILTLYKGMPLFNHPHSKALTQAMGHGTNATMSYSKSNQRWALGCMACILGTLLWSSWFILQSIVGRIYPYQYSSTAVMSFMGAIQSAVLCLATKRNKSVWILQGKLEVVTVLYSGMVGSGLCYVGMSWCVKKRGPVFTAAFSPLIQIMAAAFDIPILHEDLHLAGGIGNFNKMNSLVGSIVVIVGLYILLWGKNKEMQNQHDHHASKVSTAQEAQEMNSEGAEQHPQPPLQVMISTVSCDSSTCP